MSSALVPSTQSGPNFTQQGSVDWVALSNSTLHFSVEVLSRFSKAGVEMITIAMGQALFSGFKVPPEGQKRLSEAIAKLKAISSYGKVLWFGFGIKHVVRTLCETEQGATCAAICACLSVSYDNFFSSKVLKALADASKAPNSLTPSLAQWGALMNVCAGAVTDSTFANTVEGFSRLLQDRSAGRAIPLHEPTTPETIAGALLELCKVTNGSQRSVTFEGGVDCGWLAAVAQWFLCLRIEVVDSSGEILYWNSNSTNGQYPQLTIIRNSSQFPGRMESMLVSRSYYVPAGKLHFGLLDEAALGENSHPHLYSQGRSEWNSILCDTFGEAAAKLLHQNNGDILAEFLCSGISYFAYYSSDDRLHTDPTMTPWGNVQRSTISEIRQRFLSFAAYQLPELKHILNSAKSKDNGQLYINKNTSIFSPVLKDACSCKLCSKECDNPAVFCFHRLGVTIFKFLWILSWCDVDLSTKPSPNGLLILYYTHRYGDNYPDDIRKQLWNRGVSLELLSLFTGFTTPKLRGRSVSALSDGGMCVFLQVLKDPNVMPLQFMRHILLPGQIELSGSIYRQVFDRKPPPQAFKNRVHLDSWLTEKIPSIEWKLMVEETLAVSDLHVAFDMTANATFKWNCLSVGITALREAVVARMTAGMCWNQKIKTVDTTEINSSAGSSWVGLCHDAKAYLSDSTEDAAYGLPNRDKWVLTLYRSPKLNDGTMLVLRGSSKELYHTLFLFATGDHGQILAARNRPAYLARIGTCIPCLIKYDADFKVNHKWEVYTKFLTDRSSSSIKVFDSLEYLPEPTQYVSNPANMSWLGDPIKKKRNFYRGQRKADLEGFLRRRGLQFSKRMKRDELIDLLQQNDVHNANAATEDGFNDEDIDDSDVVMLDDV